MISARAQAPPALQRPAPQDTGKASYELQEKCAHDASQWYKREWEEGPAIPGLLSNYTNHYSAKLRGCFIVVNSTLFFTDKSGKNSSKRSNTLTDVLENKDIGTADWYANEAYNNCKVNGVSCSSPEEWAALLKPYMENRGSRDHAAPHFSMTAVEIPL
jgi:hypothetical protein